MFSEGMQLVFTGRQYSLNCTSLKENHSSRWSNQAGKIVLTANQFTWSMYYIITYHYIHVTGLNVNDQLVAYATTL